jgi:hypothetical protein
MFRLKNLPLTISLVVVVSLIVGWGISMVWAWTNPTASPPSANVATPINVSSTGQYKTGIVGFSTSGYDPNYGLTVGNNATYGLKSDKASWFGSSITANGYIRSGAYFYGPTDSWAVLAGDTNIYLDIDEDNDGDNYLYIRDGANGVLVTVEEATGEVGIGTTTPSAKLHVVGGVRITGLVNCNTIDTDANGNLSCGTDAGGSAIGGGGTKNYIPKFTSGDDIGDSSMSTSGNNVIIHSGNLTIDNGGLLVDYNLSVGGWTNITGKLKVNSTIEADGQIYAHGNIQTEGRFYGLLGKARCYTRAAGKTSPWPRCDDGDYMIGMDISQSSGDVVNISCCGSSQNPPPGGGGGGDPGDPCLVEGTKIKMADGTIKNIEDIKVGEKVLAYDIGQKKVIEQMVLKTSIHPDYRGGYYLIETESGHQLKATGNHPLYVGDSYVLTSDLRPLDVLYILRNGEIVSTRIKSISFISEPMSVYNFEIENDQNYFGNEILVHNAVKPI